MPVVINPGDQQPGYGQDSSDFDPYNVYVKNLPFDLSEDELGNLFHGFGEIKNLRIMKDPINGRSLGFGFVRYRRREDAQAAINQMDGTQVGGRPIQCRHAGQSKFHGAGRPEDSRAVHVRPLPPSFSVEDLRKLVDYYGEIEQISILTNPDGTSRGVGFVKFMDPSVAQRVATELNTTVNNWDKQITAKMVENNPMGSIRAVTTIDTGGFFEGVNKNTGQGEGSDGGNWRGGGGGGWRGGRGGRGQGGWGGGGRGGWQGGQGGGGYGNDGWGGSGGWRQGQGQQGGWNQGGNYQGGGGNYSQGQGGNYNAQQGNFNQGGSNYNQQQQQWGGNQGGYNQGGGGGDGSWGNAPPQGQQGGLAAVGSNLSDRRNSGYTSGGDSGSERTKTTFVNPNFVPKPQTAPAAVPTEGYDDYSHAASSYDSQNSGQYQENSNYPGGSNNNNNYNQQGGYQSGGNQGGYNQNYSQGNNQWGSQNQTLGQNYGGDQGWRGGGGGGKMGGRGGYGGDFGGRGRGGRGRGRFAPYGGPPGSGAMGPPEDLTNVFIFHLPLDMDENGLRNMYAQYGNVESVKVMMDRETGISRGFGFVKFSTPEEAQNAINQTDGMKMAGKFLSVSLKSKKNA